MTAPITAIITQPMHLVQALLERPQIFRGVADHALHCQRATLFCKGQIDGRNCYLMCVGEQTELTILHKHA